LRIMVTGAGGMLGRDLVGVLEAEHELLPRDLADFDVTDHDATVGAVSEARPEVVIHLAAFTDVEACEDNRQQAFRLNALGSMNVAAGAREVGAYLVYLSTDYVFDGRKSDPYVEIDEPRPLNFYGLTKLYGERYVRELTTRHLIVRTSWLFGPHGRNFVDTIVAKASRGTRLTVVSDQRGCPTYTLDLARGIAAVVAKGLEGVVHLTNTGSTTWYDLAKLALDLAGIAAPIEPVSSGQYPTKARRPTYSVLASLVLEPSGIGALPLWQDGLKDHLRRRGMLAKACA
jgi:dTDP-4-dehydrorhamnose reductase